MVYFSNRPKLIIFNTQYSKTLYDRTDSDNGQNIRFNYNLLQQNWLCILDGNHMDLNPDEMWSIYSKKIFQYWKSSHYLEEWCNYAIFAAAQAEY